MVDTTMNKFSIKRYCAGTLTEATEDFYWDTKFSSWEEAAEWGLNHNCTHIYDTIADEFTKITEED